MTDTPCPECGLRPSVFVLHWDTTATPPRRQRLYRCPDGHEWDDDTDGPADT